MYANLQQLFNPCTQESHQIPAIDTIACNSGTPGLYWAAAKRGVKEKADWSVTLQKVQHTLALDFSNLPVCFRHATMFPWENLNPILITGIKFCVKILQVHFYSNWVIGSVPRSVKSSPCFEVYGRLWSQKYKQAWRWLEHESEVRETRDSFMGRWFKEPTSLYLCTETDDHYYSHWAHTQPGFRLTDDELLLQHCMRW